MWTPLLTVHTFSTTPPPVLVIPNPEVNVAWQQEEMPEKSRTPWSWEEPHSEGLFETEKDFPPTNLPLNCESFCHLEHLMSQHT